MLFAPPASLTTAFVALTLAVAFADLWLLRRAAPAGRERAWTTRGAVGIALWMAAHAALAPPATPTPGLRHGVRLPHGHRQAAGAEVRVGGLALRAGEGLRLGDHGELDALDGTRGFHLRRPLAFLGLPAARG